MFIDTVLPQIARRFPGLRLVLEHVTTREAVQYVAAAPANVAATITAHHLLLNRNAMFAGRHPPASLLPAAAQARGAPPGIGAGRNRRQPQKFFLGTDSAPHARRNKEAPCGHAGIYSAHAAIELYAEAFEAAGALDKFEAFASFHGADFYRLPRNTETITLRRESLAGASLVRAGRRRAGAAARRRASRLAPAISRIDRTMATPAPRLEPLGTPRLAGIRHAGAADRAVAGGPLSHPGPVEPDVRRARGGQRERRAGGVRAAGRRRPKSPTKPVSMPAAKC